ncbi:MAG: thermonuclease family protein [Alphaproteobacteria bacterium]
MAIIDGDTLAVRARIWLGQEIETRVRLKGIDAPEMNGRCERERVLARAAKAFLAQQVAADEGQFTYRLREVRWDKYGGRVIARLERPDGQDVGDALVAAGLARPYGGTARQGWCDG